MMTRVIFISTTCFDFELCKLPVSVPWSCSIQSIGWFDRQLKRCRPNDHFIASFICPLAAYFIHWLTSWRYIATTFALNEFSDVFRGFMGRWWRRWSRSMVNCRSFFSFFFIIFFFLVNGLEIDWLNTIGSCWVQPVSIHLLYWNV